MNAEDSSDAPVPPYLGYTRSVRLPVFVLYFEGITTVVAGLIALFAAGTVLPTITPLAPGPAAFATAKQLGAAWIVIGSVVIIAGVIIGTVLTRDSTVSTTN